LRPLTAKQQRFIDEYPVDLNATQAARRAGYSPKTAFVIGYENLKKDLGGGPRCLDSLMGGISSDSVGFFLVKHQAASANG